MTEIDVSALETDLETAKQKGNNGGSSACALLTLAAAHPEAAGVLRRAVYDLSRSNKTAATILTRNGLPISESSIKRHRQGACIPCQKAANQ